MIKLLHCADLHLDSPLGGYPDAQRAELKKALLEIPGKLAQLIQLHRCDILLLAGDVFDGACSAACLLTL